MPEQEIGRRFSIKPENLPAPKATTVASSRSFAIPYAGQTPRVPDGFKINLFAGELSHPQRLLVLPNGDAIVAEQRMGYLTLLRDGDGDGRAEWIQRTAKSLARYSAIWGALASGFATAELHHVTRPRAAAPRGLGR